MSVHVMKVYEESPSMAPVILNLGTWQKWVVT
jgi:hypothetical protein